MFFMVRKVFVYTIAVYFYAFHLAFSGILHCILHHFTLRFAPKLTAFSGILHCILQQNALHLAAKRTLFCWKGSKNWYKQHSFKIDFLRKVGDWWTKKALRMLNLLLKTRQKKTIITYTHAGTTARKARTLTSTSASGCRACKTISYNSLFGVWQ